MRRRFRADPHFIGCQASATIGGALPHPDLTVVASHQAVTATALRWILHDMRNPVQALCMLSELSAGGDESSGLGGAIGEFCERMTGDLRLMERLLRPLPPAPAPRPLVPADSVRFAVDLLGRSRANPPVDASSALGGRLPAVAGSEEYLDLALLNLLLNAVGAGASHIVLGGEASGGRVRLWVADDGPGIPREVREVLFTGPVTTRSDRGHRGIGLLATRHVARALGGDVAAADADVGARFDLWLPAWAPAHGSSPPGGGEL